MMDAMETPKYGGQEIGADGRTYYNEEGDPMPLADMGINSLSEGEEMYNGQMRETQRRMADLAIAATTAPVAANMLAVDSDPRNYGGIIKQVNHMDKTSNPAIKVTRSSLSQQLNDIDKQIAVLTRQRDNDPEIARYDRDWDQNDNAGVANVEPESATRINDELSKLYWNRALIEQELRRH